ncbi:MAG: NADH-quinone oxidoreductase subunit L [Myxococcales bacterium]|nr:NADH-quinone oxidoreductase subunit L [Myxococcales bacterium]
MSSTTLALVLLGAPLVAFFIALVVFRKNHVAAMATVLLGGATTCACALTLLATKAGAPAEQASRAWLHAGGVDIHFGILLDGKTLIMGAAVGVITLCVQVYSLSYMSHDQGRGRFFAFLALFEWAMLSFVYSPSLMQTFVFWELVGLASFFLIGFWHKKPSAIAAAKKAFIITRIGDVGLFIGLILLFQTAHTLDIQTLNTLSFDASRIELITLLLFVGIVGKSAQFPLHTWLPDAMEGPTPVSALLHSATMVAAGVFLFARFHPLFMQAELTLTIVLCIATFTAVLSSTMAMVATDMKRVFAYSSISQLGFMLMGLGAGSLFAGYFHLTTHAIFKALLFLCAGAFIHEHGTNDTVAIGRNGGRNQRIITLGLIVGGGALAGFPLLAGFFSKELIIHALHDKPLFLAGAYLASFMTAYYTFRVIFLVVFPNKDSAVEVEEEPADSHDDHHGSAWPMHAPILLLTAAAIALGWFGDSIATTLGLENPPISIPEMAPAIGVALAGILIAWFDFGRKSAPQTGFVFKIKPLYTLFKNGWYLDAIYKKVFVGAAQAVAGLLFGTENHVLDKASDGIGQGTLQIGSATTMAQSGRLPVYIGVAVVCFAAVMIVLGLEIMR